MRTDEMRDTGLLAGRALDEVADVVCGVHGAIARRLFDLAGDRVAPIRAVHDGIAALAYGGTKLGVKYLPPAVGLVAGAFQEPGAPSAHDDPKGRFLLGVINGFWGDRIVTKQAAIAPEMRMRLGHGPLRRIPSNLAHDADERTTGRVVVFVHGLCETDRYWSYAAERQWGDPRATYGSKLSEDDGWTPIFVNFNTGLHISDNGRELAEQLEQLVAAWPVPVTEIAIVGHSLGGLVARSAAHHADELGHRWRHQLRHIVGLGTPHLGAPLERFANWGTHRLARLPETRPIATWLGRRSAGIKDLRHGSLLEADWLDVDPDDPADHCTPATLLPGVAYSMVSATLSHGTEGLFAMDLLVQHGSAHGVGAARSIPFEPDRSHHIGGRKHHFDLLADPTVYAKLREWLNGADGAGRSAEDTDRTRRINETTHRTSRRKMRKERRAG
ncbi:MAG: hypothetical protein ABI345_05610 [Jatrophihabitans sp.]